MSRTTLFALLVLALALGALAYWQSGREQSGTFDTDQSLFEGLQPTRVFRVRVDNSEKDQIVQMERDRSGAWFLVDPIAYPAERSVVENLIEAAARNRATVVPDANAKELGLEPPRVVIELTQRAETGERVFRVELGAVDLDRNFVFARTDGPVLRTLRNLYTAVDRSLPDWRSHRVSDMPSAAVANIDRRGRITLIQGEPELDVGFAAVRDGTYWRVTHPAGAAGDPDTILAYARAALSQQVLDFADDDPQDLARYGLDPPQMTLEFVTVGGDAERFLIGRPPTGNWFGMREGFPHVWQLDYPTVIRLAVPPDVFIDHRVVRTPREAIQGVELTCDGRSFRIEPFERPPRERGWNVRVPGSDAVYLADDERVADLLGGLEEARFEGFLFNVPFEASGDRVLVTTRDGELGFELAAGDPTHARRLGDTVAGVVPETLRALACTPLDELRSRMLVELPETRMRDLELSSGSVTKRFSFDRTGTWRALDAQGHASELEAEELWGVLDDLLHLKAETFVAPEDAVALEEPVEIVFHDVDDQRIAYEIGLTGTGDARRPEAQVGNTRATLRPNPNHDEDLHRRLLDVLSR